jgi:hypothetical protein
MTPNLLALYVALSSDNAVLHCVRAKNGTLVSLQVNADEPQLTKGQTFGQFVPNDTEGQFIDMVTPKVVVKADPMADRLKKSEIVKPVQFVLRFCMANPDMDRKTQIATLVDMGIATYTARTQVQNGRKRVAELRALAEKVKSEVVTVEDETEDENEG